MINLHIKQGCPFCQKVLKAAEEMGMQEGADYITVDSSPGTPGREKVLKVGGKAMVPFLIDGDHSMYESDDIIEYLRSKKGD